MIAGSRRAARVHGAQPHNPTPRRPVRDFWRRQHDDLIRDGVIGVVLALATVSAAIVWDSRLADRQRNLEGDRAARQEIAEDTRFVRQASVEGGPKPFIALHLAHASLAGLSLRCDEGLEEGPFGPGEFVEVHLIDTFAEVKGAAGVARANERGCANFTDADLRGADLSGADLRGAIFVGADLTDADLTGSLLTRANLFNAKLRGADLNGTDLTDSWLNRTDLTGAGLNGANMDGAIAVQAKLDGADIRGVDLRHVVFALDESAQVAASKYIKSACYDSSTIWVDGGDPPFPSQC